MPKGLLYPLISSFRALIYTTPDGSYAWKKNPKEVLEQFGPKLISTILNEKDIDNPDILAKNTNLWDNLFKEIFILGRL